MQKTSDVDARGGRDAEAEETESEPAERKLADLTRMTPQTTIPMGLPAVEGNLVCGAEHRCLQDVSLADCLRFQDHSFRQYKCRSPQNELQPHRAWAY